MGSDPERPVIVDGGGWHVDSLSVSAVRCLRGEAGGAAVCPGSGKHPAAPPGEEGAAGASGGGGDGLVAREELADRDPDVAGDGGQLVDGERELTGEAAAGGADGPAEGSGEVDALDLAASELGPDCAGRIARGRMCHKWHARDDDDPLSTAERAFGRVDRSGVELTCQIWLFRAVLGYRAPMDRYLEQRIAAELRAELARQGRSRHWLADQIGKPVTTVARWLRGPQSPGLNDLDAICQALGMGIADLLSAVERNGGYGRVPIPAARAESAGAVRVEGTDNSEGSVRDTHR